MLATKQEIKNALMGYFEVNEDIGNVYVIEGDDSNEDTFTMSEMDKIDEHYINNIIEYMFKYHVGK